MSWGYIRETHGFRIHGPAGPRDNIGRIWGTTEEDEAHARLVAAAKDAVTQLEECAAQFRAYAKEHRMKADIARGDRLWRRAEEAEAKAKVNEDMAGRCEAVIRKAREGA